MERLSAFFPVACVEEMVSSGELDAGCVKLVVSKTLSLAILAGALLLKLPQILNIVAAGAVTGLSPASFYLETVTFTATVLYSVLNGFPFTTYGESAIILVQNILLVFLLWRFSPAASRPSLATRALIIVTYAAAVLAAATALPPSALPLFPLFSMACGVAARVPQVLANARNGHTGQLSLITWAMNLAGGCARIFTTLQEVDDPLTLTGYIVGAVLSAALTLQILWYWKATEAANAAEKAKQGKKKSQ